MAIKIFFVSYIDKVKCTLALEILIIMHVHVKIDKILTQINKGKEEPCL